MFEREYLGGFADPPLVEEQLDLFIAETLDFERTPRHEMFEVFDFLKWTRELAGAARAGALGAAGNRLADNRRSQRARTCFRKSIILGPPRPVLHDRKHLWNDVPGALNRYAVAYAHTQALDLVFVVQG